MSDRDILAAVQVAHEHLGLVIEPAGAAGLAAIATARHRYLGRRVATILCGSNLSPDLNHRLIATARS